MRKYILVVLLLGAFGWGLWMGWRAGAPGRDPRPALVQPGSPLAQAVLPEAVADLAGLVDQPYYAIRATYDPEAERVAGWEQIWLTNRTGRTITTLALRSEAPVLGGLTLAEMQVDGRPAAFHSAVTGVTVTLPRPLLPGAVALLSFRLAIDLPEAMAGDGERALGLYGAGPDVTGIGGFPILSEHGERPATGTGFVWTGRPVIMSLCLALPPGWVLAGPGVGNAAPAAGMTCTMGVSSGAPAVLVGPDLVSAEKAVGGVRVRAYVPERERRRAEVVLEEAAAGLAAQQHLLGTGLQREVELVFAPLQGATGVNLGGGLLSVDAALLEEQVTVPAPPLREAGLAPLGEWDAGAERRFTIYHELGHLWWSELTRPGVAGDQDESLSEATALLTLERTAGTAAAQHRLRTMTLGYQYARLQGVADLPLNATEYTNVDQEFVIAYSKGGLYYDRVRRQVGDAAYFGALRAAVQEHRLGVMPPAGPVERLRFDPAVARLYRRWVEEARGDDEIGVLTVTDPVLRRLLGLP